MGGEKETDKELDLTEEKAEELEQELAELTTEKLEGIGDIEVIADVEEVNESEEAKDVEEIKEDEEVEEVGETDDFDEIEIIEEDFEEEEQDEEVRRGGLRSALKKVAIGLIVLVLGIYIGVSVYFFDHFSFNTVVNGMDQSFNSAKRAETYVEQKVKEYALVIRREDGMTEKIVGTSFDLVYKKSDVFDELVKSQNPWAWPLSLFQTQELNASVGIEYDENKLEEVLSRLNCMDEDGQIEPVSATPKYNGTEFEIVPEQSGTQVDKDVFFSKVKAAISCFDTEFDMSAEGCYTKAKYTSDSLEVINACEQMNKYLSAKITYVIGSKEEVVDQDVIQEWVFVRDTMEAALSATKIKAYVASLAEKYDTYGTERTFTTASGLTAKVSGGDYGWKIDQDAEYKALVANLKNYEVVEREPEYAKTAVNREGREWGDTYVEVDLTNQKVYLVKDGTVILDTPCVTGNTSKGWITPAGVYSIKYLKKDAVLRGPKKNGVYEWESPVTFWMPFNGAIGLHDASWQTSFGKKDGYLITGSRGCVNLQYDAAKMIFENATAGTPVICYFIEE